METKIKTADKFKFAFKIVDYKIKEKRLTSSEKSIIETKYGPVKGVKRTSVYGYPYYNFEKIPFAKPPIGELRFKAPEEPEPWTEPRDCTKCGAKPVQKNIVLKRIEGSEDCLYLNVYTKSLNPTKPLPVMVWIYGGGFQVGEASRHLYSPDYLMKSDIVMVSVTYRLGPLGFLSLNDPDLNVPGNAGLKDQIFALKWVKENIKQFGGDPDNVTVFGESAGAASTHFLMITDKTKGLFHKAIIQSGSALAPWAISPPHNWTYRLAKSIGFTGKENDREILEFLRNTKASTVVKHSELILTEEERHKRIVFSFAPVVEPYTSEHCVIPKSPKLMMRETWSNSIPLIIGGNSFEGLLLWSEIRTTPRLLQQLNDCEDIVPNDLNIQKGTEKSKEFGRLLKEVHFGDKEPSLDTKLEYLDMYSLKFWWHPIHRTVLSRLNYASAPTYLYRFDFDSKFFNHLRILTCGKKMRGTCHGDDMSYLFHNAISKKLKQETNEYKTIDRMVSIWTKFAETSDPNNESMSSIQWKPLEKQTLPYECLNIADEISIIDLPESDKLKHWDTMYSVDLLY